MARDSRGRFVSQETKTENVPQSGPSWLKRNGLKLAGIVLFISIVIAALYGATHQGSGANSVNCTGCAPNCCIQNTSKAPTNIIVADANPQQINSSLSGGTSTGYANFTLPNKTTYDGYNSLAALQANQTNPSALDLYCGNCTADSQTLKIGLQGHRLNDVVVVAWGDNSITTIHESFSFANCTGTPDYMQNGVEVNDLVALCQITPNLTEYSYPHTNSSVYLNGSIENGSIYLTVSHTYAEPGRYNVSAADLYNYSNTVEVTIPSSVFPTKYLIVQNYNTYLYIPINTTNETLVNYICKYAPVALADSGNFSIGEIYTLSAEKAAADFGYQLVQSDPGLSYLEEC